MTATNSNAHVLVCVRGEPDLREQFMKLGGEPMSMTPDEFARFVRSEIEASAKILKEAGIKPQ